MGQASKPKIVVSLLTAEQEFQQMQAADARVAAQRAEVNVEVIFAGNNAIQQIHQLYAQIHAPEGERPAAIVVEAVSRVGMKRIAQNAVRAGIAWVVQQWKTDYLDDLRAEFPGAAVASVAVDEHEIGGLQARQLRALLPRGGTALLLQGPKDSDTAVHRVEGLERGLMGTGIELRPVLNGDWTEASGRRALSSWLRLKSIEAGKLGLIAAQNDAMAAGARNAMLEHRQDWKDLPFTGCDGLPNGGRELVARGQLDATIIKPPTAGTAVEFVARALRGTRLPPEIVLHAKSHPPLEELVARRGAPARLSARAPSAAAGA
jgi:ribose transport system substrate-binding protein